MDQLPTPGAGLMWCFSLGDPNAEATDLFAQLLAAGNLDWVLMVVRNPACTTLRGIGQPLHVSGGEADGARAL